MALLVGSLVGSFALTADPATASQPELSALARSQQWVSEQVQQLLTANPGSTRVSGRSVQIRPGATVTVHPNAVVSLWPSWCLSGYLCLFEHSQFGGFEVSFSGSCRLENLGSIQYSGGRFNDKMSSLDNMQSGGQARFYNYKGSGDWRNLSNSNLVIVANGGTYRRDLTQDTSFDGGNANDKIDIVRTC